jgi:hypothetical protein
MPDKYHCTRPHERIREEAKYLGGGVSTTYEVLFEISGC